MKIDKISQEQLAKMQDYTNDYLRLAQTPIDKNVAIPAIEKLYQMAGKPKPLILFFSSPLMCKLAEIYLRTTLRTQPHIQLSGQLGGQLDQLSGQLGGQLDQLSDQLRGQLGGQLDQLSDQLRGQLGGQLNGQLADQLRGQLRGQLGDQLRGQLADQLRGQLDGQLHDQLDQLSDQLGDQLVAQLDQLSGQLGDQLDQLSDQLGDQLDQLSDQFDYFWVNIWWSWWSAYYTYCKEVVGVQFDEYTYKHFNDFTRNTIFSIPYDNVYIASEKPIAIHWKDKVLHNESGPAVEFSDGYGMWMLNGVRVTKELVTTPAEQLDPEILLHEKNAEIRREIVRKIGIERIIYKLGGKVIDTLGDYELIDLSAKFPDMQEKPIYLKMKNPSLGVWLAEGVAPDCTTVGYTSKDAKGNYITAGVALHFRKPDAMKKLSIRDDGVDWYQQGDVCIWPENATAIKPYPAILT